MSKHALTHADNSIITNFHTATQIVYRVWKGLERINPINNLAFTGEKQQHSLSETDRESHCSSHVP